ncbi:DNA-processing protein DprA [Microbacterium sp. SS28]|uniref:DNA-processing protein DprA n=1 Tax=Microbacterium sp. SS28 TaxID=2919948 RepID=UPI001FA98518|nr:DNA-processing protein DprA [Microbacterium sp. SS28]
MTAFLPTADETRLLARVSATADVTDRLDDRFARVVWSHLTEPGDAVAGRLIAELGASEALRAAVAGGPQDLPGVDRQQMIDARKRWMPRLSRESVRDSLEIAARIGLRLLSPEDEVWPARLGDLDVHAPHVLWVRGDASLAARAQPSVALIGARAATSYGEHVAIDLSAELCASGIAIVSGAAYGIDGAAHRTALAAGGKTLALLAGGVDRPYPAGHTDLIGRIGDAGAVIGEAPPGSAPTKWRFLQRNRLIAALADATVVVEAGWRSGSLNTAGHALTLGRPVGAVPGPITSAASAGALRLLRESAATCITCAADVRELLGDAPPLALFDLDDSALRPRTDDSTRVRDALSTRAWRLPDEVARRSGMSPGEVEAVLGLLMLGGEVEQSPLGWRRRSADPR